MKTEVRIKIFNAEILTTFDSEIDEEGNLHIWFDDKIIIPRGNYEYNVRLNTKDLPLKEYL